MKEKFKLETKKNKLNLKFNLNLSDEELIGVKNAEEISIFIKYNYIELTCYEFTGNHTIIKRRIR